MDFDGLPFFNEEFVYGSLFGAGFILWLLIAMVDPMFGFDRHNGYIHAYSFIVVLFIFGYGFYRLKRVGSPAKRVFTAFLFTVLVYEFHDMLWNIACIRAGVMLQGVMCYPSMKETANYFCRNFTLIGLSYVFIHKKLEVSKTFIACLGLQLAYLACRLYYAVEGPIALMYIVDVLPYLFVFKEKA